MIWGIFLLHFNSALLISENSRLGAVLGSCTWGSRGFYQAGKTLVEIPCFNLLKTSLCLSGWCNRVFMWSVWRHFHTVNPFLLTRQRFLKFPGVATFHYCNCKAKDTIWFSNILNPLVVFTVAVCLLTCDYWFVGPQVPRPLSTGLN